MVIAGPYCLVCHGRRVVRRSEYGVVAWTQSGPVYGYVDKDVCLDCEARDAVYYEDIELPDPPEATDD